MASWLIVGCGYTGGALARRLVGEGHDVAITRRDAAAARATAAAIAPRVTAIALDLARPAALPACDVIAWCAPPGADPRAELALALAPRVVYVSSTGVYPPAGGAWVDERWPVAPATAAGRARAAAEAALPAGAIALRAAGIYGPGRMLADRIRAGGYRIVGDGASHVSRIHVEDLVTAIVRAGACALAGPVNCADDDPAPIGEVADAIAARLGLPPPPRVPAASVDPELAGMLTADRRIANGRMKRELGVALRYPSWRDA
ncbi:MAG TPA: NAD-dependent epimerase/dehydratase family protein [Kofleriaceae bacterium]|nr:NAD-dependent epimerase/dehydratase family protein [Kofleriaceae bacterium]